MRAAFIAVALLAVACADGTPITDAVAVDGVKEADDELTLPMPVHSEHFMDYVIALVDEYAPDAPSEEEKSAATASLQKDENDKEASKAALTKAKAHLKKMKKKVAATKKDAKTAVQKSDAEQKKAEKDHIKAEHDQAQETREEEKLKLAKTKLKEMKKEVKHDESKVKSTDVQLKKDKKRTIADDKKSHEDEKMAQNESTKAEKLEKESIDAAADEKKKELAEHDAQRRVEDAKAAAVQLGVHSDSAQSESSSTVPTIRL